jgi:hypothetical protein
MVRNGESVGQTAAFTAQLRRWYRGPTSQKTRGETSDQRCPAPRNAIFGAIDATVIEPGLAVDAQPVEDLLELFVVDVVGGVEVFGLGDEFQRVIALQSIAEQDVLEWPKVVGIHE